MTPGKISSRITADRLAWIDRMLGEIRRLPLSDLEAFLGDSRNVFTAESALRTSLEALFDLGRHILAKGYGIAATEYKEIARGLQRQGVLDSEDARLLEMLAGYRNRLVHFYHEITSTELFEICSQELGDVEKLRGAFLEWLQGHPERMDETL